MPRSDRWILLALVLLALVLRGSWLDMDELAHDEPFTVVMAHRSLPDLFSQLATENNPPLHFLLMHGWVRLVPLDEAWLRLPSAVFGALAVWPLFLLGRTFGGTRVAITAVLLFLFSNYHQGLAHEVRSYSLFTLLTCSVLWVLWMAAQGRPRAWIGLWLLNTLLLYTHFLGWAVVGLQVLLVLFPAFREARRPLAGGLLGALLLFAPYGAIFLHRVGSTVTQGTWLTAPTPEELYNMVWRWSNAPVMAVSFLAVIGWGLARRRAADPGVQLGLVWAFLPLFALFGASFITPVFLDRYLAFAAPGFALVTALSLAELVKATRFALVPMILGCLGMALTFTPWKGHGLHPAAVVARAEKWRGDAPLIIQPSWYRNTYAWHLDHDLVREPALLDARLRERGIFPTDRMDAHLPRPEDHATMVRVDAWSELTDPEGTVPSALRQAYPQVEVEEVDRKVMVERYSR